MPAYTKAAIEVIQKNYLYERGTLPKEVMDFYPIYQQDGNYLISILAKINSSFNRQQAIRDGLKVGAVIGKVATIRIPVQWLREDFYYPGIEYIEVAEKTEPELDKAIIDARANLAHQGVGLPGPVTGKNVIIGIADWGFDYTHPAFYDTSLTYNRLLAAWDQEKRIGNKPDGFSHGAYYKGADELAAAQHDTISVLYGYHGTHVAGIAGGSGGGTPYRGMGIECNLLFSQMSRDVGGSLDAFYWMQQEAQAAGKRLVINNSWGGYRNHPLDGTSLTSQAIDELSAQGVVFVFSAGNNGDINFHLQKTFNNDSVRTRIMGFNYATDNQLWGQTISMWGEAGHSFSVQLRILDDANEVVAQSELINTSTADPFIESMLIIGPDTVFYNFITDAIHPLNNRPQLTLNVRSTKASLKKTLLATAESGTVHFWNTRLTTYGGGNWGYGFTAPIAGYVNGDKNYGIGHPGVTNSVITVAAHQTDFLLTGFSSTGPRMDGVMKPDISAPGQNLISAFNSFALDNITPAAVSMFQGKEYKFIPLSGTSMSAPMVAGAAALLLEADPTLSAEQVKNILLNEAREDNLTGPLPAEGHVRWGHGKLDVYNALVSLTSVAANNPSVSNSFLFPNPATHRVYVTGIWSGNESYAVINITGQICREGIFDGEVNVSDLPPGLYALQIRDHQHLRSYLFTKADNH